ncbi:hypothetical protein ACGF07_21345 [Kitasatospora sp. NPDC048194]|uniref:hypothetical protein n=1 Tax=Kitasatospora sp. NPDC048194 TaxID=3364045 RepID=UPI003720DE5E
MSASTACCTASAVASAAWAYGRTARPILVGVTDRPERSSRLPMLSSLLHGLQDAIDRRAGDRPVKPLHDLHGGGPGW